MASKVEAEVHDQADGMAFAERIWIRCRWGSIPGEDTERCSRLAYDFAATILERRLDLFRTDYPHLLGFVKQHRFLVIDLHCDEFVADASQIPFRCFTANYGDEDDV